MLIKDFGKFAPPPKKRGPAPKATTIEVGEIVEVLWSNGLGKSLCRIDHEPNGQLKMTEVEEVWF